ncbi:threonine-phosphate decarboxylase CobD [Streptococcus ovuberis]|uniref:threonine-phosphate decarboxylase n=1 Tax=Streptococcus ovuberis TaxID=1936207 RepID=A0A7X6N0Y7_9STRE|nr:threonine-phosphate decarboxylase CobD [Streptococcus ovuberis]NKZ21329.1 threonine-phosphate decarboxylase [Streptococcus ovuberis]
MIEHGGNVAAVAAQRGGNQRDFLDLSANINPLGLPQQLKRCLQESITALEHYPDSHYRQAREFLAEYHCCQVNHVGLWNGAIEAFYELARLFRPQKVVLLQPTFMEYEEAFRQVGAMCHYVALEGETYHPNLEALLAEVVSLQAGDVVVICNPNNPTGSLWPLKDLVAVATALRNRGAFLILDEAFMDFVVNESDYSFISLLSDYPNVIVVRSLTKFYAIPGLRLGYSVSYSPLYSAYLQEGLQPWRVNALAQAAVPVLLEDKVYQEQTAVWLCEEQPFLYNSLKAFSVLTVVPPSVNYIFFRYHGQLDLREALLEHQVLIRSCANYNGLTDHHYRVAIRSREENQRFLAALALVLDQGESE